MRGFLKSLFELAAVLVPAYLDKKEEGPKVDPKLSETVRKAKEEAKRKFRR